MSKEGSSTHGIAVVTGASVGIGKVYAERLARQGYDLHLVARRGDKLKQLAEELSGSHGVSVQTTPADLTKADDVQRVANLLASEPALTLLVNNAGVSLQSSVADTDPSAASDMIALNVTALTQLTIAALSGFKARNKGTIINISSGVAFGVFPGIGVYSATKAYILHFTRTLQAELQGTGIVVQVVAPGATVSEGMNRALEGGMPGIDPAWIMTTEDCVDASLKGLADGEAITVPPVEDAGLVTAFTEAGTKLLYAGMTSKPASRYGLASRS